jgi:ribosomal protein S27AE
MPATGAAAIPTGGLLGTWNVVCRKNHVEQITGLTLNLDCPRCGNQMVTNGNAAVLCGRCEHIDFVKGSTHHHKCSNCGQEVRMDV